MREQGRVAPTASARLCLGPCLAPCPARAFARQHEGKLRNQDPWEEKMTLMRLRHLGGALIAAMWLAPAAFAQAPAPAAPSAANPWFQGAPFPDASEEVLGATAGGKVYVFAGLAPGWKPKAMVYEYDPASNQWTKKRPMRLASHHVAFATLNNKIYALGGFTYPESGPPGWNAVNNAWEYDPAADEWKELAPMPTRRGAASAGVANGKIYVTGGVGDKVYVIGGRVGAAFISSASNNVDLVEMYDPANDLWTPRARMPTARSAIGAGVYNNNILVAGGEGQDQRFLAAFKAVEAYNPALNRWEVLPSMPHPRHGLAAGVIGNRLYTVSGDGQSAASGIDHSAVAFNEILQVDLVLK